MRVEVYEGREKIRDVFDKGRDPLRQLVTVIKVGDDSRDSLWTEFDEFVVTEELLKYTYEFFKAFDESGGPFGEPIWPVWLQGFYGSGKSHFSKVIGYVLQNSEIVDPSNLDRYTTATLFAERVLKGTFPDVPPLAKTRDDIRRLLEQFPKKFRTSALFFNLAYYARRGGKKELESFTYALMREINQFLGLSDDVYVAEIERALITEGKYGEFKDLVREREQKSWEEIRQTAPLARKKFIQTYCVLEECSEIVAKQYVEAAEKTFDQRRVDEVLSMISEWARAQDIPERGIEGRVILILDEAGLFFSASTSRISELQTAAEWVNTKKNDSRVHMIFTSQQTLEKHFERSNVDKADYHKTGQRFRHWSLGKQNIRRVVAERWLRKDQGKSGDRLRSLVDDKFHHVIDGTKFDVVKDPLGEFRPPTRKDIEETYPFVPYQIPLMIGITQRLIEKGIVKEEYGGKTRSILQMTRDILEKKANITERLEQITGTSLSAHFVDDPLGHFVNASQIYDSIVYTVEDPQTLEEKVTVEKTQRLEEDEQHFTEEERAIPITFIDVAKTIFLFGFVDEVYASEANIARALYFSVEQDKRTLQEKVKKLVKILLDQGFLSHKEVEVTTSEATTSKVSKYWIASRAEQAFLKKVRSRPVDEKAKRETLATFFRDGRGKLLLKIRDKFPISTLYGKAGKKISFNRAITLWSTLELDPPVLDDSMLERVKSAPNPVHVCVLTCRSLVNTDLSSFRSKLLVLSAKAYEAKKILLFVVPDLSQAGEWIESVKESLDTSIAEIFRISQELEQNAINYNLDVQQRARMRKEGYEEDLLRQLRVQISTGQVVYKDMVININQQDVSELLNATVAEIYSSLNPYAYLGQLSVSAKEVKLILTWDPKRHIHISPALRKKTDEHPESIFLFDDEGDLKPNLSEQFHLAQECFKALAKDKPDVTGEALLERLSNPPYSWNAWTIILVAAAAVRNQFWDVAIDGTTRDPSSPEVLKAFTSKEGKFSQFRRLSFQLASEIGPQELENARTILTSQFEQPVFSPTNDEVDEGIQKALRELVKVINDTLPHLTALGLDKRFVTKVTTLKEQADQVLAGQRQIKRIREFLKCFGAYASRKIDVPEEFPIKRIRKTIYRVRELRENHGDAKYHAARTFLSTTVKEWLDAEKSKPLTTKWRGPSKKLLSELASPSVLSEAGWADFWKHFSPLWEEFWDQYVTLHRWLQEERGSAIAKIEAHSLSQPQAAEYEEALSEIFNCQHQLQGPPKLEEGQLACPKCERTFPLLKLRERELAQKIGEILRAIEPPSPTPEQAESWRKYREYHAMAEASLANIEVLLDSLEQDPKARAEVEKVRKKVQKVGFPSKHICSEEPESWESEQQACATCQKQYLNLIDVIFTLSKLRARIFDQIGLVPLPFEQSWVVEVSGREGSGLEPSPTGELDNAIHEIQGLLKRLGYGPAPLSRKLKIHLHVEEL
ncbi:MAG: hypothetical protein Kow0069_21410 [Promethearchaeota archaeon]